MRNEFPCSLYYTVPVNGYPEKRYIPQVELKAHASVLSTASRTIITQVFTNPSKTEGIKSARYTFPLYDGVSVVGFQCRIGDRLITGEVKEKQKARQDYKEAVERGEKAALLEHLPDASDCFTTSVGNIPPGADAVVTITYLGELKHDMEVDGIRYTIPTRICQRYGEIPAAYTETSAIHAVGKGTSISVDVEVAEGSFIQKILSPSHPISVSMGTTSLAPNAEPVMTKASAALSLDKTDLGTDFVIQIVTKDSGTPKAILEQHPIIPNYRALMATLVPRFALPPENPEIVFVCDRSGSMSNTRIKLAKDALEVLLKSLPVGVKLNICSFGSRFSFLWERSVTYSQETLDQAMKHVRGFAADYGGTRMLQPLAEAIKRRYTDIPLDIIMLTDGQVWDQDALFSFLNDEITVKRAPIRAFTLGIGNGVSHSLIEGIARAGNGFSQSVGEGERMETKLVRMLKGALSPHVTDYSMEVKYGVPNSAPEEDEYDIIEKISDALSVQVNLDDERAETEAGQKKTISLFDTSADPDKHTTSAVDTTGQSRYSHLPKVPIPKIIQAPQNIPPLFAFNRTTVYLLLGPDAPQTTPKSIILRGTSKHGPLELEIPVQVLEQPGDMVHQLAAKKAIAELEQGRGWLPEAKDKDTGKLLKEQHGSQFSDMVEREAVRLGVQFQVGGKWCSFVALEKGKEIADERMSEDFEFLDFDSGVSDVHANPAFHHSVARSAIDRVVERGEHMPSMYQAAPMARLVGHISSRTFGEGSSSAGTVGKRTLDSSQASEPISNPTHNYKMARPRDATGRFLKPSLRVPIDDASKPDSTPEATPGRPKTEDEILSAIIGLQSFSGSWTCTQQLLDLIQCKDEHAKNISMRMGNSDVVATALVVVFLEEKMGSKKAVWELIAEKAKDWLKVMGVTSLEQFRA